ncbi:MAG: hypothetical protein LN589_03020 [Rickettsia endosymbiont of Eriopis connexa]|nr:hypothetical protein [Rickettsia endosymbiont of Eriopis connexa]
MVSTFYFIIVISILKDLPLLFSFSLLFFIKSIFVFYYSSFYIIFSFLSFFVFFFVILIIGGLLDNLLLKFSFFFSFMFFNVSDYLSFFIFFELSLIFMVVFIIYYGRSYNKIYSALIMIFFTVLFSILFIFGISFLYYIIGSISLFLSYYFSTCRLLVSFLLVLVLLVKFPLILIHFWLPKAHVDSPTQGSMYLAGIILKMGSFGILVIINQILYNFIVSNFLIFWGLFSSLVIISFCILLIDIKRVIAYSSISHMSFSLIGVSVISELGVFSSVLIMFYHGLSSPFMF